MKPLTLIIEDDPAIRESLADRLESLGHDCQAVGAQNEAGERIDRCSYSYVLLDLELPVRFGRPPSIQIGKNILQSIRASARNKDTPVIVVTAHGHDRPDLAVELMKAGAVDFVRKPFDNLEQAIREALQRSVNNAPTNGTPDSDAAIEMRPLGNGKLVFKCDEKDDGDGPLDRQQWIIDELKKGRKLRRCDLEKHFGISTATAKRDLGDLADKIEFIGIGKAGYYEVIGACR